MARSAPAGLLVTFATHPMRFGMWPRTNTTTDPSAEMLSVVRSMPSSSRNRVSLTGRKSGAAAV